MEGVAGIVDWDQVTSDKGDYSLGRDLMVGEANAAIEGAAAAGAKTIVLADSHGSMFNMPAEKLHPAAEIVQGRCRGLSMMEGVSKDFDMAAFIGYHAMACTERGCLAHTYSGSIRECKINGRALGEPGLNATLAAHFGVPLVFLSGDEAACREAQGLFPGLVTAPVKKSIAAKAARSLHPSKAREAIKAGIEKAIKAGPPKKSNLPKAPYHMTITLRQVQMADLCERIPYVTRKGATGVEFEHEDFVMVYGAFLTIMRISGLAAS